MRARITLLCRAPAVNNTAFEVLQLHHLDGSARHRPPPIGASGQMRPALRALRRELLQTLRWRCRKGEPEGLIRCLPCLGQVVVFH